MHCELDPTQEEGGQGTKSTTDALRGPSCHATPHQRPVAYVFPEEVSVRAKLGVDIPDELHHVLHCPQVGVLPTGPGALSGAQEAVRTWRRVLQRRLFLAPCVNFAISDNREHVLCRTLPAMVS